MIPIKEGCGCEEWQAEAKRIASAFGVRRLRIFYKSEIKGPIEPTRLIGRIPLKGWCLPTLFFCAYPSDEGVQIEVRPYWNYHACLSHITLADNVVDAWYGGDNEERNYMAKGAFLYGYTPEQIEAGIGVTISAHQQLEWTLEASQ